MGCEAGCASGWVYVDARYVASQTVEQGQLGADLASRPPPPGRRDSLENSVRPCDVCNPESFKLWAAGHYRLGHACPDCRPHRRKRPTA